MSSQVSKLCYNAFVTLFKQDSVGSVSLEVNYSSLPAYILRKNISLVSPSEIIFISSLSSVFKTTTDILALAPQARKQYRMELLFTHKNGDFGAISVTE